MLSEAAVHLWDARETAGAAREFTSVISGVRAGRERGAPNVNVHLSHERNFITSYWG